jgi:NADH:ubiquinone oxidoreductase subunit 6 (subunit J)
MIDFSTLAIIGIAVFVVSVIPAYWLLISAFREDEKELREKEALH